MAGKLITPSFWTESLFYSPSIFP